MMTPFRRALACALSASLALSSAGAFAQKKKDAPKAEPKAASAKDAGKPPTKADREKAKAAFKRGDEKFAAGDFAGAAEAFKEANATIPAPQATYRLALSLDKAGKTSEAAAAYKEFLAAPPPDKMGEQKTAAEARLKELSVGSIKLTSNPAGATVTVDGTPASGPTPVTLSLPPGAHSIVLSSPDHEPVTRELTVAAGTSTDVAVELKPVPPPAPPAPVASAPPNPAPSPSATPEPPVKDEPPPSKVPAYVTLGLAGAGVVVGTIFGVKALSSKSDFKDNPTTSNADDTERNALIADMAFGVALTLGITGTVLLLSNKKAEPAKTGKLRLMPIVTPQTQGAAAVLRF